jgi:hypothetical protein
VTKEWYFIQPKLTFAIFSIELRID